MEFLLDKIKATKSNAEFFDSMRRGQQFGLDVAARLLRMS
jgi:hypothetical protein